MEVAGSSETQQSFYSAARRHIPRVITFNVCRPIVLLKHPAMVKLGSVVYDKVYIVVFIR